MIVLEFDAYGRPKYWIDEDDPVLGYSLWKRDSKGDNHLVKNIPVRFRHYFKNHNKSGH